MEQKSVRGKHEIKAAVIRGQIYIYIYTHSWIERENSHREKKGRTASNKEKKRERERGAFRPSFLPPPPLFSIKKRISRDPRTNERASWVSSGGESSGNDNCAVKFTVSRELKSERLAYRYRYDRISDGTCRLEEISSYSSALSIR